MLARESSEPETAMVGVNTFENVKHLRGGGTARSDARGVSEWRLKQRADPSERIAGDVRGGRVSTGRTHRATSRDRECGERTVISATRASVQIRCETGDPEQLELERHREWISRGTVR